MSCDKYAQFGSSYDALIACCTVHACYRRQVTKNGSIRACGQTLQASTAKHLAAHRHLNNITHTRNLQCMPQELHLIRLLARPYREVQKAATTRFSQTLSLFLTHRCIVKPHPTRCVACRCVASRCAACRGVACRCVACKGTTPRNGPQCTWGWIQ